MLLKRLKVLAISTVLEDPAEEWRFGSENPLDFLQHSSPISTGLWFGKSSFPGGQKLRLPALIPFSHCPDAAWSQLELGVMGLILRCPAGIAAL